MPNLKEQLRHDMIAAMKAKDALRRDTLRMVLSAVSEAEVAGSEAVQLNDQQTLDVVISQAKRRREAEQEYVKGGREDLAAKERAEAEVLADYLPQQLSADEIAQLVTDAVSQSGAAELGMRGMGKVMGIVTPQTKGRADGAAVAAEVKRQLSA